MQELLSEYIGPINRDTHGVHIGDRSFRSAIGIIAGGTGLEALTVAKTNPESAVVVVDPIAKLGKDIVRQLSRMKPSQKSKLDWSLLESDRQCRDYLSQLVSEYEGHTIAWGRIVREFMRFGNKTQDVNDRIFWVPTSIENVRPDIPLFDAIHLNYPLSPIHVLPATYSFLDKGLIQNGRYRITTDMERMMVLFLSNLGASVTSFGRVNRQNGIKHPQSVYDIALGDKGYYYIEGDNSNGIPVPDSTALMLKISHFGLPFMGFCFLQSRLSKKRVDFTE